jgi:hypothetical protein
MKRSELSSEVGTNSAESGEIDETVRPIEKSHTGERNAAE